MAAPAFDVLVASGDRDPTPGEQPYGGALEFPSAPRPYVVVNFVACSIGRSPGFAPGVKREDPISRIHGWNFGETNLNRPKSLELLIEASCSLNAPTSL